jgi:4-hydroxy-tetrahydrodipicolinate synthase
MFSGVFTALVTPFTTDGAAIDFGRLEAAIALQALGRVQGVVPCGTTGESPTLSEDEHRDLVERTIGFARRHGLLVIAGAGSNSTAHAVELHRFAARAGADAALHVCPYYNKPSQEGLYRHFATIADSADLPIVLYNIPGRTAVALTAATIGRLAAHPNIQAIKEATGSLLMASEVLASTDLALLSGDDPLTLPMMSLGGTGVISVLSNLVPGAVADLCRAALSGDLAGARRSHFHLLPLAKALLELDTNPVPVKTALAIAQRDSGALRLPLVRPADTVVRALERLVGTYGLAPAPQPA